DFGIVIRYGGVEQDEILVGVQVGAFGQEIDHLERAGDQHVVIVHVGHRIIQTGLPVGGVGAELNGVDFNIEVVHSAIHTALRRVEEGLVAENRVDDIRDPQRPLILRDGGGGAHTQHQ